MDSSQRPKLVSQPRPAPAPAGPQREERGDARGVWSPSVRQSYRERGRARGITCECDVIRIFYRRLMDEIQSAQPSRRPLAVLIVQVPPQPPCGWQRQQLEHRLRLSVRDTDFYVRL
jgi:hypothetical protein